MYVARKIKAHYTDDLPIIRENIKRGFLETQSKVSSWVTSLRKKIDGDDDDLYNDGADQQTRTNQGYDLRPSRVQSGNRRSGETGRRSVDRDRYDADPQVLGDDFTNLQLHDLEGSTCYWLLLDSNLADQK